MKIRGNAMQVRSQPVAAQRGLVMIMTLVMLAVMTVGAAVAVRMSVTTDMVGANLRARSLAFQAAEAALRYCEEQVISNPYTTRMLVAFRAEQEWNDDRLWEKGGPLDKALRPGAAVLNLPATIKKEPECLIRHLTLEEWRELSPPKPGTVTVESRGFDPSRVVFYRITARGFSPDYRDPVKQGNGLYDHQTAVGAEIRLQSMIRAIQ